MKINYKINNFITNLKQINNKRTLVNLYKDIVLVTRLLIFCTTLFTNNNIKVVIQMHAFLFDRKKIHNLNAIKILRFPHFFYSCLCFYNEY